MSNIPGTPPSEVQDLARLEDRLSFVYFERAIVGRSDNAITIQDELGIFHLPSATLGCLLLGPGTTVTHQAMMLLADSRVSVVWVGEQGVRYYAHGRPLAGVSKLAEAQARLVSSNKDRLAVARKMYEMRFPDESVASLSLSQLRGREGARVRKAYRTAANDVGLKWSSRQFKSDDYLAADLPNQALSAATACLYGLVQSVVAGLGCSPALGFVHSGHDRSFVFDIADLYKCEIAVPVAFRVAADQPLDVGADTRRAMREKFREQNLVKRCVRDLYFILGLREDNSDWDLDAIRLWDDERGSVPAGVSYRDEELPW